VHLYKLILLSTFVGSLAVGTACTSPEAEACEKFKDSRDACEAMNGNEIDPVNFDLCANVDPECKEFYECAVQQQCTEVGGVFRLDYGKTCTMPEDKACTDADLRP
jgi:hypothetical protein